MSLLQKIHSIAHNRHDVNMYIYTNTTRERVEKNRNAQLLLKKALWWSYTKGTPNNNHVPLLCICPLLKELCLVLKSYSGKIDWFIKYLLMGFIIMHRESESLIASLAKEVIFMLVFVCLFVCLSFCLFVCWLSLLTKLWTEWDEIVWKGPGWKKEQVNPIGNQAITQQIMSGFRLNVQDSSAVIQRTILIKFQRWFGSLCWLLKSEILAICW